MNDSIKNIIKAALSVNTYSNAAFYKRMGNKNRRQLEALIGEMRSQDYFLDISELQNFQKRVKEEGDIFSTFDTNWSNAHIYGIWQSVFGSDNMYRLLNLPSVEHGLIFHQDIFTDLRTTGRHCFVTLSRFRKEIIQSKAKRPVFCVGPYISYSNGFYNKDKLDSMKKKLGKTLLVFPTHSTDTSELTIDQERFIENLGTVAKKYDSVLINTFWWNINDPLIQKLSSEGYRIISCGFRDDPMFLQRLKSYINLADMAIGDSIGTHVGYCINEKVPFSYQNVGTNVKLLKSEETKDYDFHDAQIRKLERIFDHAESITQEIVDACNYYWGNNLTKTQEQISDIVSISEELTRMDHGFTHLSYKNAYQLLKKYKASDIMKYQILRDAL